jgi:hypothetical protein
LPTTGMESDEPSNGRYTPPKAHAEVGGSSGGSELPRVDRKPIMVMVSLDMLRWLQIGLKEGRVAASPYAVRDAAVYAELAEAIAHGEDIERLAVEHGER